MLHRDRDILFSLIEKWKHITIDPKFDLFCKDLQKRYLASDINPSGKLVVFSESVDTLSYLYSALGQKLGRRDILLVTASNRGKHGETIKVNFDANHSEDARQYNILLTSDVLAEGVNLHRANVIINYDSPWNASRLMQRIGRVNRIGSTADTIHNFLFYPSSQGDKEIQLYKNALIKLQSFHSAFGEDAQIFSREEIVKHFELYDSKVTDVIDRKLALLREVRELYNSDRAYYHKIKALPKKSRVMRSSAKHSGKTVAFISSPIKTEYYLCSSQDTRAIDLLEAVEYLKATPEEEPAPISSALKTRHFEHVNNALQKFCAEHIEAINSVSVKPADLDKKSAEALKYLRTLKRALSTDSQANYLCDRLIALITEGVYSPLPKKVIKLAKAHKAHEALPFLQELAKEYNASDTSSSTATDNTAPGIIISETFI